MAVRPYWKGYLKLSLVTCPVQMMPATSESEKVRFHTLNRETNNRVVSHYVDAVTGKEVKDEDEVKGYQRGENEYIILEDEELESVALDSKARGECHQLSGAGRVQRLRPEELGAGRTVAVRGEPVVHPRRPAAGRE